jgi:hypothetical protein
MLLGSKQHTQGDTRRWQIDYSRWLANAAVIDQIDVESDSDTCTVSNISILGHDVIFFLTGGMLNEQLTVTLTMADNFGNIKTDTIAFTCVAP